jgi:lysophospholipase L1-like esterase
VPVELTYHKFFLCIANFSILQSQFTYLIPNLTYAFMNWESLVCLGDSITFGARSYLGYPEICGAILEKRMKKSWHVINHSTCGFTTMNLVRSLNSVMLSYKEMFSSIITIMIGTNDIKDQVPEEDFLTAYDQLIVKARLMSVNNNVLLFRIPRFTNMVFYPYHFGMNSTVELFNRGIEALAVKHGLRTIDLKLEDDHFYDGVHFNDAGSGAAGAQLAAFILKDKGIEDPAGLS